RVCRSSEKSASAFSKTRCGCTGQPGPNSPAQLDSFRSNYELPRPPRGPEIRAAVIHMAVSMFETAEPGWARCREIQLCCKPTSVGT
ncbi:MAG: hypothetical protein ACLP4R_00685, partial [Solirubrobacteraceae bacterium]